MTDYSFAKGSASTDLHAAVDALAFYSDLLPLIPTAPGSIIIDFGGGIGRDALAIHARAGGQIQVFNIDPEPVMWADAQRLYPGRYHLVDDKNAPSATQPNYVRDRLPALAVLRASAPNLKADFALCNAVLMFIRPEDRAESLNTMLDHVKPGGTLAVRFRTVDLKTGMHPISEDEIDALSAKIAFSRAVTVTTTASIADPAGRTAPDGQPYLWHQRLFTLRP